MDGRAAAGAAATTARGGAEGGGRGDGARRRRASTRSRGSGGRKRPDVGLGEPHADRAARSSRLVAEGLRNDAIASACTWRRDREEPPVPHLRQTRGDHRAELAAEAARHRADGPCAAAPAQRRPRHPVPARSDLTRPPEVVTFGRCCGAGAGIVFRRRRCTMTDTLTPAPTPATATTTARRRALDRAVLAASARSHEPSGPGASPRLALGRGRARAVPLAGAATTSDAGGAAAPGAAAAQPGPARPRRSAPPTRWSPPTRCCFPGESAPVHAHSFSALALRGLGQRRPHGGRRSSGPAVPGRPRAHPGVVLARARPPRRRRARRVVRRARRAVRDRAASRLLPDPHLRPSTGCRSGLVGDGTRRARRSLPVDHHDGAHSPVRRYPWDEAYPALQRAMAPTDDGHGATSSTATR